MDAAIREGNQFPDTCWRWSSSECATRVKRWWIYQLEIVEFKVWHTARWAGLFSDEWVPNFRDTRRPSFVWINLFNCPFEAWHIPDLYFRPQTESMGTWQKQHNAAELSRSARRRFSSEQPRALRQKEGRWDTSHIFKWTIRQNVELQNPHLRHHLQESQGDNLLVHHLPKSTYHFLRHSGRGHQRLRHKIKINR